VAGAGASLPVPAIALTALNDHLFKQEHLLPGVVIKFPLSFSFGG
jgi:hypothetical protein